jgi:2-succinyl-5-enolpyruvyl-6-hydroxy-3-cyclohexene-1-carboxylate synthase
VTDPNTVFARSFVAGLEAAGVRHACVCPGSRNTPLSLALADSGIDDSSHHDERSAGFYAIGIAKQTGTPVVVVTTSGTAATELHPAIAEADASAVPIIAITADRPSDLIGRSAPQTIDQRELFGPMVRWHFDADIDAGQDGRDIGERAVREAVSTAPGPTHCNLRFPEPLVIGGASIEVETTASSPMPVQPVDSDVTAAAQALSSDRGVIVVGPQTWRGGVHAIAELGQAWGWPVMADPLSGLRAGLDDADGVVGSDLLAAAGWLDATAPDSVMRFGAPPTSKALNTWLTQHPDVPQIAVAPWGTPDPGRSASMILRGDPGLVASALQERPPARDLNWLGRWRTAQATSIEAAVSTIAGLEFPSEPAVAAAIGAVIPDGSTLWAGSSMPIRDIDSFFPVTTRQISIHGHRGANGIDGLVSAALGSASTDTPTVALTGDVAMLHDIGSLATMARLEIPLTVLVVNNDGGGIFHFLPQAGHEHFERHFGTPHGASFTSIGRGFGLEAQEVSSGRDLEGALTTIGDAPRLLEVRTDRTANVDAHRAISAAVTDALAGI